MTDPFVEEVTDQMSQQTEPTTVAENPPPVPVRQSVTGKHVCPYCGSQTAGGPEPCPRCTMEDTPATRQATKARIGPWYVLQTRNPAAPGMKFATLLALINKGHIAPRSVLRGPTTHQLWRFAAHVRGVSREFGLCYSCGGQVERSTSLCPHCQRSQEPPVDPDVLLEGRSKPQTTLEAAGEHTARLRELRKRTEEADPRAMQIGRNRDLPKLGNGRVLSTMHLAAALQEGAEHALHPPKRRFMRFIGLLLLVLILSAGAGAAVLWLKPEYQKPTFDWANHHWGVIRANVVSLFDQKPAKPSIPGPEFPQPTSPVVVKQETPKPRVPVTAPQTSPTPSEPQVAKVEKPADPAPLDPAAALDKSRQLWVQALDADGRKDFASAVKLYREIERLPESAWPKGLQLRLKLAMEQSGQSKSE